MVSRRPPRPEKQAGPKRFSPSGKHGKGLKLLFIHQNFPAQYFHIALHYAADPANTVVAVGEAANLRQRQALPGVIYLGYDLPPAAQAPNAHTHHYVRRHEMNVRRGQAVARLLAQMREQGFDPDVICVHPDWGEALFIRLIWPQAPILAYAEHYDDPNGPLLDFDPAFPATPDMRCMALAANATRAISFADATHLQTPTRFQWQKLPPVFRAHASLLYDGINTRAFRPDPAAALVLAAQATAPARGAGGEYDDAFAAAPLPAWFPMRQTALKLTRAEPVVTFISRTLEPFMGWPAFARAIPLIQAQCPQAHFVIVGRTSDGYGPPPPNDANWRDLYLEEIRDRADLPRLHFLGTVTPEVICHVLALSRAHVYLVYPFSLSYSPVEAMSSAAPLVLSDTAPAREIADDGVEALFVDFHSPEAIAEAVLRLLRDPALAARLGQAARARALARYGRDVWLPRWKGVIETLARGETPGKCDPRL